MPRGKNPKSKKPKKQWYLTVGVSQIDGVSKLEPLPYATQDCQDIARLFEAGKVDLAVDEVFSLHDGDESALPTAANLKNCLKKISREAGEEDTVVVYLTCHGILDLQDEEKLYFCLRDTQQDATGNIDQSTAFSAQELVATLIESKTKNLILLIDSCHSGALKFPDISIEGTKNLYAILSCFPQQESFSYDILQGALMSHCLKKVLRGDFLKYIESPVNSSKRTLCCDSLYNSLKEKMETIEKRLYEHQRLSLSSQGQQQGIVKPQQQPIRKLGSPQTDNFTIAEVSNVPVTNIEPRRGLLVEIADSEVETSFQAELIDKACFDNLQVWNGRQQLTKTIQAQLNVVSGTVLLYFRGKLLANNELQINQQIRLTASTLRQLLEQYQSAKQILLFDLDTEDKALRRQWIDRIKIDSELGQCIITNDCSQQSNTLARDVASLLAKTNTTEGLAAADLIQQLKQSRKNREYYLSGKRDIIEVVLEARESSIYSDTRFWRNYVHKYFPQEISSNFLTSFIDSRVSFKTKEFYVPLGLLERKKIEKKKEIESSEQGSRLYEAETETIEVTQTFAGEEFYRDILLNRQGKTNGEKIAITGEPGGGKTTLSQDICGWLLRNTQIIPIWISLAQLGNGSLTEYLEQLWLLKIARDSRIELEQLQEALENQFLGGNVWLILDGVDEINSNDKIRRLRDYLQEGYIDRARVIVTSRLNTWETGHQLFDSFETYRTLPFTDSDIKEFIGRFFTDAAEKDKLTTQLEQNQRIKDLVRNPLRLILLCSAWLQGEGTLPETQAQLYDLFVESFYSFKHEQFPIFKEENDSQDPNKLKELIHRALGEIGKAALDNDNPSFLIDLDHIDSSLKEHIYIKHEGRTIRKWIQDLGWLNKIGVKANDKFQNVYTFFHASFQEYFAASIIDDWDYFVPRNHDNFPVPNKKYRIFEPQWRQVILFWIGQKKANDKTKSIEKEAFIDKLFNFNDGLSIEKNKYLSLNYSYQALVVAGLCTSEFNSILSFEICSFLVKELYTLNEKEYLCSLNQDLVFNIISNYFYADIDNTYVYKLFGFFPPAKILVEKLSNFLFDIIQNSFVNRTVRQQAMLCIYFLEETNKKYIPINNLIDIIQNPSFDESIINFYVIEILGEVGVGNKTVISLFMNMLQSPTRWGLAHEHILDKLSKVGVGNKTVISLFMNMLQSPTRGSNRWIAAHSLGQIGNKNKTVIDTLINIVQNFYVDKDIHGEATNNFALLVNVSDKATKDFDGVLVGSDRDVYIQAIESLGQIGNKNETVINVLIDVLQNSSVDRDVCIKVIESLGQIGNENETVINALIDVLRNSSVDRDVCIKVIESLGQIGNENETVINVLIDVLQNSSIDKHIHAEAIESLCQIAVNDRRVVSILLNILQDFSVAESIYFKAATSLPKVAVENQRVIINFLINLLQSLSLTNSFHIISLIICLTMVGIGDKKAISTIVNIHKTITVDEDVQLHTLMSLEKLNTLGYVDFYKIYYSNIRVNSFVEQINNQINVLQNQIQPIYINANKFINRQNPVLDIYKQMVKQGCPKISNRPQTISELSAYWELDVTELENLPLLIFYEDNTESNSSNFSTDFLDALGRFDGAICVISNATTPQSLKHFYPNQPNLFENIIDWIQHTFLDLV